MKKRTKNAAFIRHRNKISLDTLRTGTTSDYCEVSASKKNRKYESACPHEKDPDLPEQSFAAEALASWENFKGKLVLPELFTQQKT